jgi:hypothetical protein
MNKKVYAVLFITSSKKEWWDRGDRKGRRFLDFSHFDREYLLSSRNIQAARRRNKKGETKFCFAFFRARIFYDTPKLFQA